MKDSTFKKYCLVVDEWLINGFNGTKAYQKFYPECEDKSAESSFRELVGISRVAEYLESRQQKISEELKLDAIYVVKKLHEWIELDVTDTILCSAEELKELPEEIRKCITKFKRTTTSGGDTVKGTDWKSEVIEIGFTSKEKALEMLSKHIGLFEKDNSQRKPESTTIINLGEGEKPESVKPVDDD